MKSLHVHIRTNTKYTVLLNNGIIIKIIIKLNNPPLNTKNAEANRLLQIRGEIFF